MFWRLKAACWLMSRSKNWWIQSKCSNAKLLPGMKIRILLRIMSATSSSILFGFQFQSQERFLECDHLSKPHYSAGKFRNMSVLSIHHIRMERRIEYRSIHSSTFLTFQNRGLVRANDDYSSNSHSSTSSASSCQTGDCDDSVSQEVHPLPPLGCILFPHLHQPKIFLLYWHHVHWCVLHR